MAHFGSNDPNNPSHQNPDGSDNAAYYARQREEEQRRSGAAKLAQDRLQESIDFQNKVFKTSQDEANQASSQLEQQRTQQSNWVQSQIDGQRTQTTDTSSSSTGKSRSLFGKHEGMNLSPIEPIIGGAMSKLTGEKPPTSASDWIREVSARDGSGLALALFPELMDKLEYERDRIEIAVRHASGNEARHVARPTRDLVETVTELRLDYERISDIGLGWLASAETGLGNLERLWLSGTQISDRGIVLLADAGSRLPGLTHLVLDATRVSDAALRGIASPLTGLRSLRSLSLLQTSITDEGLAVLASSHSGLTDLNEIFVGSCPGVSASGVARLKASRPALVVRK